jgi:hypothetical protein
MKPAGANPNPSRQGKRHGRTSAPRSKWCGRVVTHKGTEEAAEE